jgi:hypothetical protein
MLSRSRQGLEASSTLWWLGLSDILLLRERLCPSEKVLGPSLGNEAGEEPITV